MSTMVTAVHGAPDLYLAPRTHSPVVVPLLSRAQLFMTPWTAAHQSSLSFTISRSMLKLMSIESVTLSNHLILSSSSPALALSQNQVLCQGVRSLHQVAKIVELQLQHQSFQ